MTDTTDRITRTQSMMLTASIFALRSTCQRKMVGAVLAHDNRIIATGYNGAPSGMEHCTEETCNEAKPCKRTIHAEMNAILFAAKYGISTKGSVMYTTLEPCLECSKAMINAGIVKVVYGKPYRLNNGILLLKEAGIEVEQYKAFITAEGDFTNG